MALCRVRNRGQCIANISCARSTLLLTSSAAARRRCGCGGSLAGIDLARFQPAFKRAHHSTGSGRNDIVQG